MKMFAKALTILAVVALSSAVPVGNKSNKVSLADNYELTWVVEGDRITFTVTAQTLGYVGFGISPTGNMYGGDMMIGGVNDADGTAYFGDYHSDSPLDGPHLDDEEEGGTSDWFLVAATQTDTATTVTGYRLLDTGDSTYDNPIGAGLVTVIYAFSDSDDLTYHGPNERGQADLDLLGV